MQISKSSQNNLRNIRIRTNSRSKSKGSDNQRSNVSLLKPKNQQQTSNNFPNPQGSSIVNIILKKDHGVKNNIFLKFDQSKEKKKLLITGKENRAKKQHDHKSLKRQNQNQLTEEFNLNQNQQLYNQQEFQKQDGFTRRSCNKSEHNSSNDFKEQELYQTKRKLNLTSLRDQNLLSIRQTHQSMLNTMRSTWLCITSQVSLTIHPFTSSKASVEVQTIANLLEDKYFLEYIKQRQLKTKTLDEIQQREQKLKDLIDQTIQFKKNYKQLMDYSFQNPSNDREKRVFNLSVDLQFHQKKIKEAFSNIASVSERFQKELDIKLAATKQKNNTLFTSIEHLINACILEVTRQGQLPRKRVARILKRVLSQFSFFHRFFSDTQNYGVHIIQRYQKQSRKLSKAFQIWSNLLYQNRVLLYNFMKQIQKIPLFTISLFGYKQTQSAGQNLTKSKKYQKNYHDFVSAKCQDCYKMQKKIDLIRETNMQIKPLFKVIQWLIRDCKKNKQFLEII